VKELRPLPPPTGHGPPPLSRGDQSGGELRDWEDFSPFPSLSFMRLGHETGLEPSTALSPFSSRKPAPARYMGNKGHDPLGGGVFTPFPPFPGSLDEEGRGQHQIVLVADQRGG